VYQAEIDSACELVDFWRFNPTYARELYTEQPISPGPIWNYVDYRPLEGFVFAVTPFNFTSIAGNLPTSPALMGNTVLWKPASTAVLSGYYIMQILQEAGMPDGVINFLPGSGGKVGNPILAQSSLAGVHFTGSTDVFQSMWATIGGNIAGYATYPRIVGETGGKDFVFAHPSADADALVIALVRGAFEYQGQKCSAASRAYIPRSLWNQVREGMREQISAIDMGTPLDFTNFMGAMIDEAAFDTAASYLEHAKNDSAHTIVAGGGADKTTGFFIEPTLVESTDPKSKLMSEEIFAPILTVFVYEDADLDSALELCDTTSPYSLTGAIFCQDRGAIAHLSKRLRHASGNFYINDKPTGAVVGQQPFGGARASGTNDKAGSKYNLVRWVSQRSTKETFVPPKDFRYPHMQPE
jgi:1-pyrroline-5-carboxylate dehydrogenase